MCQINYVGDLVDVTLSRSPFGLKVCVETKEELPTETRPVD